MDAAPHAARRGIRATARIQLREDVFDRLTAERGAATDVDRARLCDMDRGNLIRIRKGQSPSLELAMHMAGQLGVSVEDLFEQVA